MVKRFRFMQVGRLLLLGVVFTLVFSGIGSVQADTEPPPEIVPDSNPGYTPPPLDLEGIDLPAPNPRDLPVVETPDNPEGLLWPSTSIVINEFHEIYDQIEFYNMSASPVDMGLWKLKIYNEENNLDTTYTFPYGFTLDAGAYVILHELGSPLSNTSTDLYSGTDFWMVAYGGALSLEDNTGWGKDFVRWGVSLRDAPEGAAWVGVNPYYPDFVFFSMGRDSASTDQDYGEDWTLQNSSLGAQNLETLCVSLMVVPNGAGAFPGISPAQSTGCDPGTYVPGEVITLTADPLPGWEVGQWDENPATEYLGTEMVLDYTMTVEHKTLWLSYIQSDPAPGSVLLMGLWSNYADVLDVYGVPYDQMNGYTYAPDWEVLDRYDMVVYQTIADPFIPNLRATSFGTFLDQGGCMWVEADSYQEPGEGAPDVLYEYFGVSSVGGEVVPGTVTGLGSIFAGLGPYTDSSLESYITLTAENGAEAAFEGGAGDIFGLSKLTAEYLTTFVSYDFNSLAAGDQEELFGRMVETCIPLNDDFDSPFEITELDYSNTQHYLAISHATVAADDPDLLGFGPVKTYTVWYSFTPSETTDIQVNTFGSDYDTVLGVWTGPRGSLTKIVTNDDSGGTQSKVQLTAAAGTTYYIEIAGYDEWEYGTLVLNVTGPVTCYSLSLNSDGNGGIPTADPANSTNCAAGEYVEGETIDLTALPDTGWEVSAWNGTDDDGSTDLTNTVTMPAENHSAGVTYVESSALLFESGFETGDFSEWSRYNDGGGWMYVCSEAAINGDWGACVASGDNDKRKQLTDETPVYQTTFSTRFNLDVNSLAMGEGERFRVMQVKMGEERPFFIVLKYESGQYLIQLNTKLDDLSKVKTDWIPITDASHTIEVDWQAASGDGANDGYAELYVDDVLQEALTGLDNDTIYIDKFKLGFTSKLTGKVISGVFYIDDVATSNNGYIGPP